MEKQQVRWHASGEQARSQLEAEVKEVKEVVKRLKEEAHKR